MAQPQVAPYGSWKSPITTAEAFAKSIGIDTIQIDGDDLYWNERRPDGRSVIVRRTPDGATVDITPSDHNVRTRVHEYGGADYIVADGVIYFSNFADQRLYRQRPNATPEPLSTIAGMRYADACLDRQRERLLLIREDHTTGSEQPINTISSIAIAGAPHEQVLVAGNDFYSTPRLNADGTRLAWLTWNHPNMPWDVVELWVGEVQVDGTIGQCTLVAGATPESVFQPEWSPDGSLYFVADRSGWWNLYRWQEGMGVEALYPVAAEFGMPQWRFGATTYGVMSADNMLCRYVQNGIHHIAILNSDSHTLTPVEVPYTTIREIQVTGGEAFLIGGSATTPLELIHLELASCKMEVLRRSQEIAIDSAYFSAAEPIEFPTDGGLAAHGFYYRPQNPDFVAPAGERPPLLVLSHGGPTSATSTFLSYKIQYWTTRGFAVLDVNYGGSTGYGRDYRERLKDRWGIVDVVDCVNGAKYLVEQGMVDGNRLAIAGGSAGGYTTLCALTFYDTFQTGASYFGVSDLEALAKDTHKFESRYLDGLIGPYPERRDIYLERSPIHHTHLLNRPMILLQGLDDPIVPPNQAQMMFEAVRSRELPVAYVPFPGEQHGFRKAENNQRALEAEFYFYSKIFSFEPVEIENL